MAPQRRAVLVAEDDGDIRMMLAAVLECAGHDVITATNGAEAYNLAQQHRPALILLDLMMPTMGGEEFRKVQLASPEICDIPVVVMSAHHDVARIASRMKVAGCVEKPVDFDRLAAMVQRHCR